MIINAHPVIAIIVTMGRGSIKRRLADEVVDRHLLASRHPVAVQARGRSQRRVE
jgi:hypothetical protein